MTHIHIPLTGRFTLLVQETDEAGKTYTKNKLEFDNLITDYGLNRMGAVDGPVEVLKSVQVGTGSSTPSFSDTTLASPVAVQSSGASNSDGFTSPYHWRRRSWQFAQGAAAGNLTEIGIGTTTSMGALWSRALILDGSGNPTTLTILPTEFLTVIYELRNYPPTGDVVQTVPINGVDRTITTRPMYRDDERESWRNCIPTVNYYDYMGGNYLGHGVGASAIAAETSGPGSLLHDGQRTVAPYVSGTFYRDFTTVFGINAGNVSGGTINTVAFRTQIGAFQMGISPGVPKNNTQSFTVTTRISWGRYTP